MVETEGGATPYGFKIDHAKLRDLCVGVYPSGQSPHIRRYLPQFNIPDELELQPKQDATANPFLASQYLWSIIFFERITKSSHIMRNGLRTWSDPSKRWFFDSRTVVNRTENELEAIMRTDFQFNLQGVNEETPAQRFLYNANLLHNEFDDDPRNLVDKKTVAEAREQLKRFKGVGTGIANLFMIYLMDREIASPSDPYNALLKVDVHKGRIPINVGAVTPVNHEIARSDAYVAAMEDAYCSICTSHNLDPKVLDSALWVTGSELCVRRDYTLCATECALFDTCLGFTPENRDTGRYIVLTHDGERIDDRRNKGQATFRFA